MPGKTADQCPTAVRVRGMVAAVGTARQSCGEARKAQTFTSVRSSSGEYLMKRFCFTLLVAFSAIATTSALAQTYPNRTIRIVVPYAPGGGVSVYANLISGKLP